MLSAHVVGKRQWCVGCRYCWSQWCLWVDLLALRPAHHTRAAAEGSDATRRPCTWACAGQATR